MAQQTATLGNYIDRTFLKPVAASLSDGLAATSAVLTDPRTHRIIVRALILGTVTLTALVLAVGGYASFWWVYVPERGLRREVLLQYGEGRPPYAFVELPPAGDFVATDQPYDVTLDLTVPSSERNMDMGNFMVRMTLLSPLPANQTLHSVSRPASLSYHSPLTRSLLTLFHVRSLLSFSSSQVQTLSVPLMVRKVVQSSAQGRRGRVATALIEVGRRDAYSQDMQSSGGFALTKGWGEVQIYDAMLKFDAHFEGLRWLMYHHPIFSFFFFTGLFLATEMSAALFVWALIAYRRGSISPFESHHQSRLSGSGGGGGGGGPSSSSAVTPSSGKEASRRQQEEDEARRRQRRREEAARRRILEADRQVEEESRRRRQEARSGVRRGMTEFDDEDDDGPLEEEPADDDDEELVDVKRESPLIETSIKEESEDEGDDGTVGGSETTGTTSGRSALASGRTETTATSATPTASTSGTAARRQASVKDEEPSTTEGTEEE